MRRFAFAAILFALACTTTAQQPDAKKKTDLEHIQGEWRIVGLESGGKTDKGSYKGNTFTFRRDKKGGNAASLQERFYEPVDFNFSLDPAKTPKEINLTTTKGVAKALGIYKLDGDDLTICMSLGGSRPGEFATRLEATRRCSHSNGTAGSDNSRRGWFRSTFLANRLNPSGHRWTRRQVDLPRFDRS